MAFSVPENLSRKFVNSIRELPISYAQSQYTIDDMEPDPALQGKRWMMSAVKGENLMNHRSFGRRVSDAWTAFVDVLKVSALQIRPSKV